MTPQNTCGFIAPDLPGTPHDTCRGIVCIGESMVEFVLCRCLNDAQDTSADQFCCTTLMVEDPQRKSMRFKVWDDEAPRYPVLHDQLAQHLGDFISAYNFWRRLKTLKCLAPYKFTCKCWTAEPERFIPRPLRQMPELNTGSDPWSDGPITQPAQMPTVDDRGQYMVIHRRRGLSDPRQTHDPAQPPVLRHLRPKHQKRRNPGRQRAFVQHIKPPCCRVGIKPPPNPRVRVQIVKPNRQIIVARILRIMPYLEIADRAVRIVEHRCSNIFFHQRQIGVCDAQSSGRFVAAS